MFILLGLYFKARAAYRFTAGTSITVLSPNADYVPEFPAITDDGIFIRKDGSFGPHEFSRWPQYYVKSLCHYGAIPAEPKDIFSPLWESSILFRKFTRDDWTPLKPPPPLTATNGAEIEFAGGALRIELCVELEKALERAIRICMRNDDNEQSGPYALGRSLARMARGAMKKIKFLPDSASSCIFILKDIQRAALELYGIHNYMTVIKTRIENSPNVDYPMENYVGCLTELPLEVDMLHRVGIPVWFVVRDESWLDGIDITWVHAPRPFLPVVDEERWVCVTGQYLQTRRIVDGGHIRDATQLYYDRGLSTMMEKLRKASLFLLSKHSGEESLIETAGVDRQSSDAKRKFLDKGTRYGFLFTNYITYLMTSTSAHRKKD